MIGLLLGTFPIVRRKDEARFGTYRTRDLILGYYDAYATGSPEALRLWLGPEDKRDPQVHSWERMPEGT